MKLVFQPTLLDLQSMLGDGTYIDFVWMWRDREQENLSRERLEKWRAKIPHHGDEIFPSEAVARPRPPSAEPASAPTPTVVASLPMKARPIQVPESPKVNGAAAPTPPSAAPFPAVLEYPTRPRSRRRAGGPF